MTVAKRLSMISVRVDEEVGKALAIQEERYREEFGYVKKSELIRHAILSAAAERQGLPLPDPQWKRDQREYVVYFIRRGIDGPIKIGRSCDVTKRMSALQISCAEPLMLLATTSGDYRLEAILHKRFGAARLEGEWFRPVEELLRHIEELS